MDDPMNESIRNMLRTLQQDEEMLRSAREAMLPLERIREEQQMIRDIMPHYQASQRLAEITGVIRAQELLDSFTTPGIMRAQRAVLALLEDQERFRSSILPYMQMTEALTRTYALAAKAQQPAIEETLKGFDALQEAAVEAAEMRVAVEAAVEKSQPSPALRKLVSGLGELSDNSRAVWTSLSTDSSELAEIPKLLLEAPIVQVFQATQSVGILVALEPAILEAAPPKGLIGVEAEELGTELARINPGLAVAYAGALEAFQRRGNDYLRHVSTSLRELLGHLLSFLAPQQEVDAWETNAGNYNNGQLTRKARLRFIFRRMASGEDYAKMAEKDIDHVEQNFYVLNTGVHKLEPDLAHEQMRSAVRRCEYSLLSVLHAHRVAQHETGR